MSYKRAKIKLTEYTTECRKMTDILSFKAPIKNKSQSRIMYTNKVP